MSIRKRLVFLFTLVGLLPLLVVAVFANTKLENALSEMLGKNAVLDVQSRLIDIDKAVKDDMAKLASWSEFEALINASDIGEDDTNRLAHSMLKRQKDNYNATNDIHLYSFSGNKISRVAVSDDQYLTDVVPDFVTDFKKFFLANPTVRTTMRVAVDVGGLKTDGAFISLELASSIVSFKEVVGVIVWKVSYPLSANENIENFSLMLDKDNKIIATGSFFLSDDHKEKFEQLKNMDLSMELSHGQETGYFNSNLGLGSYLVSYGQNEQGWKLLRWQSTNIALEPLYKIRSTLITIILIIATIAIGVGIYAALALSRPLQGITDSLVAIASGQLETNIPSIGRKDEIGQMAKAIGVFKENMLKAKHLEIQADEAERIAQNEKKVMMEKLASDFESGVQGIITTIATAAVELHRTAEGMQCTVSNVKHLSGTSETASKNTSSTVQSVTTSVEEMSSSVREIASQITKSAGLISETVKYTQQADKTTQVLSSAVIQISGILELIQGIAGQINLLALNATIESARAGDAGKGFAVVASEVKNLAGQTTKATEEIAKQISSVQQASKEVVNVLKLIHDAVFNVDQYSSGISSAVEEQASVTNEISSQMLSASNDVNSITRDISSISDGAKDAEYAAKEVLGAADVLSQQSNTLNQQVKLFLDGVRTA